MVFFDNFTGQVVLFDEKSMHRTRPNGICEILLQMVLLRKRETQPWVQFRQGHMAFLKLAFANLETMGRDPDW